MGDRRPPRREGDRARIGAEVVGREREIELILAAVNTGRDLLLEGAPGTSKTTLLKAITAAWGIPLILVEGNAELTPARLLGHYDPARVLQEGYSEDAFEAGPLVEAMRAGGFLYFEEFNRAPEDTLNTLLTAIADRRTSIPRLGVVEARPTFRLIGSMNPYDNVGTTRLSVSIKDRLNRLVIDYQDADAEAEIVRRRIPVQLDGGVGRRVITDAVAVTRLTRSHDAVAQGSSVRGAIDLALMSAELCAVRGLDGGDETGYRDAFWETMLIALSGRISLDHAAGVTEQTVLREVWEQHFVLAERIAESGDRALELDDPDALRREPQEPGDRARRQFKMKPKELSEEPQLAAGAGGGGLALGAEREPRRNPDRRPGSTSFGEEAGRLDDEEGEPAGHSRQVHARAREIAARLELQEPPPRIARPGGPEIRALPYRGGGGELDLDRTLDALAEGGAVGPEDLIVRERRRTRREIVLAVDLSGSMRGERLLTAAATVGALCGALHRDDLAVIGFWSDAAVLLRLGEQAEGGRVIDALLGLDAAGLTNVSFPLEFAAAELGAPGRAEQRVLLLSDCVHNAGPDPRITAARLPRLDVLFDLSGERDSELAAGLARAGRGMVLPIRTHRDAPPALNRVLARS